MNRFERRLNEALQQPTGINPNSFLKFASAIATSTALEKIPLALQRAAELPPEKLATIIGQVEYTGDITGLKNAVASKPEYATALVELARKVLPEAAIAQMIELLTPQTKKDTRDTSQSYDEGDACQVCGNGVFVLDNDNNLVCNGCGVELAECGSCAQMFPYQDMDDENYCPGCTSGEVEDKYDTEADYYTQGEDPNAH